MNFPSSGVPTRLIKMKGRLTGGAGGRKINKIFMSAPSFHPEKAIEFLLARANLPVLYWLKNDVLGVSVEREERNLGKFCGRQRLLETQRGDGGWNEERTSRRPAGDRPALLVETVKNVFRLRDYGCLLDEERVRRAVDYLFGSQTKEGDFRATSSNEYSPGFHALALEILCKLGLDDDPRVKKAFRWILAHRQTDGGWALPCRTLSRQTIARRSQGPEKPFQLDKSKPYSHFITGMVLRALAESPSHRSGRDCRKAGELVMRRFFKDDLYADRKAAAHWQELRYPFWSTNLLSCLDSLSLAGFNPAEPAIAKGLDWLKRRQTEDGYWLSNAKSAAGEDHLWLTLAILRVFKRFGLITV
jgi:hypothetical protein